VAGTKLWVLFPPGVESLLDDGRGDLVPDARPEQHNRYSAEVAARLALAYSRALVVEQLAGEVMFVPAGWHHQVHNLNDCISINHNWTSGVGISHIWRFLTARARAVRAELDDLAPNSGSELAFKTEDEFQAQCALLLRAENSNMDLTEVLRMAAGAVRRALERNGGRLPADGSLAGVLAILADCAPALAEAELDSEAAGGLPAPVSTAPVEPSDGSGVRSHPACSTVADSSAYPLVLSAEARDLARQLRRELRLAAAAV